AANPSAQPEYNVSFRDVLPIGLSYQPGSGTPADAGEPTVITDGVTGQQTLLWLDIFDLQVGASSAISFKAQANATALPVASTILNTGNAYASTAPRLVPEFSATRPPIADPQVPP